MEKLTVEDVIRAICIDTHWTVSDGRIEMLVKKYTPVLRQVVMEETNGRS